MSKNKFVKCHTEGRFARPCKTLSKRFNDGYIGIFFQELVNLESVKPTGSYIYHKKDRKDKGLVFNFCPFCGGPLMNQEEFDLVEE